MEVNPGPTMTVEEFAKDVVVKIDQTNEMLFQNANVKTFMFVTDNIVTITVSKFKSAGLRVVNCL